MRARFGLLVAVLLVSGRGGAAEYYVAPTGNDASAGTEVAPFATLQKGNDVAKAGDTVWLRGGTYQVSKQIKLNKSGQSDATRIKFFAFEGEHPVLDFATYQTTNPAADVEAVAVTGSWLHLKGFEVKNVPMDGDGAHSNSGVRSRGASNNTFELLDIHHVSGPGLFIDGGQGGNLILNCDSHDNYDKNGSQGDGQNADGFGVHYQSSGPSTIIRGCRAWYNSDDGYDYISQEVPVITEYSWGMYNGLAEGGAVRPTSGNGNGFKAGSSKTGIRHVLRGCVAWKNTAAGFYANHSSGGNTWYNNTSWSNGTAFNMLASPPDEPDTTITLSGDKAHVMRNNLGFPNKNSNMMGVDTKSNTWDLMLTPTNDDFVSVSDAGCLGPRPASGNLPATEFLRLKASSKLVDRGENVMLPFVGAAPDLGAYEYGAPAPGTGGSAAGGAGGANVGGRAGMDAGGAPGTAGAPTSGGAAGAGGGNAMLPVAGAPAGAGTTSASGGAAPGEAPEVEPSVGEGDAGCSCRLGTERGRAAPWLALAAAWLAARRRRDGRTRSKWGLAISDSTRSGRG